MEREEQIRCLAYSIWEKEGYPHGRQFEHWLTAETIWESENREKVNEKNGLLQQKEKRARRREPARKRTTQLGTPTPTPQF
ncbi:MAG TPA: DUF2934 domain-containing protein [Candidatus Binatia bacterium]|nr:DUF2934 domain-containing protein [Candidatus Binatia bacterium]